MFSPSRETKNRLGYLDRQLQQPHSVIITSNNFTNKGYGSYRKYPVGQQIPDGFPEGHFSISFAFGAIPFVGQHAIQMPI